MKQTKTVIPPKLRAQIEADPFYKSCALYGQRDHVCEGRITREHALTYAGKSLQTLWAIIPLCAKAHDVDEFQDSHNMIKSMNVWVALNRATDEELRMYSKAIDYVAYRDRLNRNYGPYKHQVPSDLGIYRDDPFKHLESPFKTLWYPVQEEEKKMINHLQRFYSEVQDEELSPFQVLARAIRNDYRIVRKMEKDPRVEAIKKAKFKQRS